VIYPGVKWPGSEAYHSPPSNADVNNGGAIPPLPHVFMAYYLLKHRNNFTFLLLFICYFSLDFDPLKMEKHVLPEHL
jgi:hypothetical protein